MSEAPVMCKILEKKKESANACSYVLDISEFKEFSPAPGQFVMVWLPGVDEKPLTVADFGKGKLLLTVEIKGKFTKLLCESVNKGDSIGVRGPYGHGFTFDKKTKACVIGGGLGIPGIAMLVEKLNKPTVILAARSDENLLYKKRFKNASVIYATDDGSCGFCGYAHILLEKLLKEGKKFDNVYCCGPEVMMKCVFAVCQKNKIPFEGSFERYMRCGIGICGACVMDGLRVCKDGPVFNSAQVSKLSDFNSKALLKDGSAVPLGDYVKWRS